MANVSSSNSQGVRVPKLRFPGFEGEWESSLLGELGTFTKGAPLSKADISEDGTPFILYGELYTTYKEIANDIVRKTDKKVDSSQYSRIGDVVIPTSGETPDEIATATCVMLPNVILAGDLNIFRSTKVDGRIISYIVNHVVNRDISRIAQGKSVVHIKADELAKIRINFPDSNEQDKLITFLSVLSKRIEKQRQLVEALKSYKRGALLKLFPKKGENTPEYRFTGFTEPWEQCKLGELSSLITKGTTPLDKSNTGSINFIKVESIDESSGEITITQKITSAEHEGYLRRSQLKEDDILFSIAGTLGRVTSVKSSILPANTNQALAIIRLKTANLKYVKTYLKGKAVTDYIKKNPTVGAQPNLSLEQVGNLEITLPSEAEQSALGDFFEILDNLITLHQCKLNEFQELKSGLLQQLFI